MQCLCPKPWLGLQSWAWSFPLIRCRCSICRCRCSSSSNWVRWPCRRISSKLNSRACSLRKCCWSYKISDVCVLAIPSLCLGGGVDLSVVYVRSDNGFLKAWFKARGRGAEDDQGRCEDGSHFIFVLFCFVLLIINLSKNAFIYKPFLKSLLWFSLIQFRFLQVNGQKKHQFKCFFQKLRTNCLIKLL